MAAVRKAGTSGAIWWSLAAHLFLTGVALRVQPPAPEAPPAKLRPIEMSIVARPASPAPLAVGAPALPERGEQPVPLSGPADAWSANPASPNPNSDVDTPDLVAAARGGGASGAPAAWTGRHDGDQDLHAIPWNSEDAYRLDRQRDARHAASPEPIARQPDPAIDDDARDPRRRAREGQPQPPPRPEPGTAREADARGPGAAAAGPTAASAPPSTEGQRGVIDPSRERPLVEPGPTATEAEPDGAAADRVDSKQASNERDPGPIELSRPSAGGTAGEGVAGPRPGDGNSARATRDGSTQGGTPHDLPRAAGGRGTTQAPPQNPYYRRVVAKIMERLVFPEDLKYALHQGHAVVSFTIRRDGRLGDVRLTRPSGFQQFDEALLSAVRAAAPFDPPPADLEAGKETIRVTQKVRFDNPVIR